MEMGRWEWIWEELRENLGVNTIKIKPAKK